VVLFEALTGKHPFRRGDREQARTVRELMPEFEYIELEHALSNALRCDPEGRTPTMAALREDLELAHDCILAQRGVPIDAATGARWFYHAHPPEERDAGEHGHFHLFLDRTAFPPLSALAAPQAPTPGDAEVVHILALSIDLQGLPTRLFSVNRWVTDEWLHAAPMILERLHLFDVTTAGAGDPLVNRWLTAALAAFAPEVEGALAQRDAAIAGARPTFFEDRALEILSEAPVDLQLAATRPDR